jgi:hypothetical protein
MILSVWRSFAESMRGWLPTISKQSDISIEQRADYIARKAAAYAELIEGGVPALLQKLDNLGDLSPHLIAWIKALPPAQFQALCWDIDRIHSVDVTTQDKKS